MGETPIAEVEAGFRKLGAFLLVDMSGKKLWFFHHSKDEARIRRMMDSLRGRSDEMVKFLLERASVRVRPK